MSNNFLDASLTADKDSPSILLNYAKIILTECKEGLKYVKEGTIVGQYLVSESQKPDRSIRKKLLRFGAEKKCVYSFKQKWEE